MTEFFSSRFSDLHSLVTSADEKCLRAVADKIVSTAHNSRKVVVVGNGGSAAIASHLAVDLTKAAGIRTICFNEASLLTCLSNDYGYENWVQEALEAYCDPGDLVILISSSGSSANMIKGAHKCRELDLELVTLSGFDPDNLLRKLTALNLWVNSQEYNLVENTHQIWLLSIVDYIVLMNREDR